VAGLTVEIGPWVLRASPLVALVGWSRIRLWDHTVAQVLAGATVGAIVAGSTYALAR
jgi:hypothetical protein